MRDSTHANDRALCHPAGASGASECRDLLSLRWGEPLAGMTAAERRGRGGFMVQGTEYPGTRHPSFTAPTERRGRGEGVPAIPGTSYPVPCTPYHPAPRRSDVVTSRRDREPE